jgi:hypothetical protein
MRTAYEPARQLDRAMIFEEVFYIDCNNLRFSRQRVIRSPVEKPDTFHRFDVTRESSCLLGGGALQIPSPLFQLSSVHSRGSNGIGVTQR